ncbi:MAG: DUF2569 family protein [Erysipelotrichaceae bacterium]|jgi:hypothetical protein|nr:DUF2569 family protein [Erysipelotrichaceae bacterium]
MDDSKFKKLGGWLLFYVVCCVVSVVFGIMGLIQRVGDLSDPALAAVADKYPLMTPSIWLNIVLSVIGVGFGIWMLSTLRTKSPATPAKIRRILVLNFAVAVVGAIAVVLMRLDMPAVYIGLLTGTFAVTITAAAGMLAVWYSYFKKSARVKAYYGD